MSNLFSSLPHADTTLPALITPGANLSHGALRKRIATLQVWLQQSDQSGNRPLLLASEPSEELLAAFIAAGALGRTAAIGDARWPIGPRGLVERALSNPLTLPSAPFVKESGTSEFQLETAPRQPFYIGFTSGTSGLPKGYARSHPSWIATMEAARDCFALRPGDRILTLGPLSHSLALYGAVQALWLGGTALLNGDPSQADVVIGVPPLLAVKARTGPHRGVRLVLSAGQALDPGLVNLLSQGFPNARLIDFYGTSEQSFIAWRAVTPAQTEKGAVGHPFPGVTLSVVGKGGLPLPPGETGRLKVASPMIFDRYVPGLEGGGFQRDGAWTTVGDRGWLDDEGVLHLAGREGGMVVVRGINVFPEDVESRLKALPGVTDAGVTGLPDPLRGATLVALIEGRVPDADALSTLTAERRPRRILTVPTLPRTLSGKLDRAALRDLAQALLPPLPASPF
ncbi:AMP-binding protein [Rhodospirillum sp. A1_3_36]|uniref:AMP-binding protein n=1 Tax=Rhodospirillum sp. A1_3_36 TaxID=3391666 RepID=UPI0039A4644D